MREPSLDGAKAKFAWSGKHLKCLDSKIKRWIETNPHTSTTELYPEARIVALRSNAPEPPLEFGVMAGNIIH